MSERDPGLEAFSKFIVALEPWLGEVVLGTARRERIRSKRKAEGYEGSGRRFVPVASLHRDIAYLSVEGGVRRGERIRDVTEADGADCQPGKFLGTKNSHPRAAGLPRQS